ncbi:protein kinase domain-containing protein [Demequina globuliformis]|uniref:protein kinase domain-containing protein n=1 Tax=Demequina globuliformis TaxID=676202 RepID=UPI000785C602|nr:hypothetical protein [Demequina globuliformis]
MADTQPRVLRRSLGYGAELAARARRRGARLRALNRVDIVAPIEVMSGRDGEVTCALPALTGVDLATLSARREPLNAGEVRWLGERIASALTALHGAGLAHADLSPANVLIRSSGIVLLDTLAGIRDDERGTPGFRAPEILAGQPVEASDVYSLGCLLRWAASDADCARVSALTRPLVAPDAGERPEAASVAGLLADLGPAVPVDLPGRVDVVATLRSHAAIRTERTVAGRPWRWTRWAVRAGVVAGVCAAGAGIAVPLAYSADGGGAHGDGADGRGAMPGEPFEVRSGVQAGAHSGGGGRDDAQGDRPDLAAGEMADKVADVVAAAEGLTHARFQALATGDGEALRATVTGDSETAKQARTLGDDLDTGVVVYEGLVGTVVGASVESVEHERAEVTVEYALSDHTVVRGGDPTAVEALTEVAVLSLRYVDGSWRVATAAPAP